VGMWRRGNVEILRLGWREIGVGVLDELERAKRALEEIRAEGIDHLYCGHCGGIEDVRTIDFREGNTRHVCRPCRILILEWI